MCWPTRKSPFAGVLALVGFSVPHFVAVHLVRASAPKPHSPTACPLLPRPPLLLAVPLVAAVPDARCIAALFSQARCTGDSTAPRDFRTLHNRSSFQGR